MKQASFLGSAAMVMVLSACGSGGKTTSSSGSGGDASSSSTTSTTTSGFTSTSTSTGTGGSGGGTTTSTGTGGEGGSTHSPQGQRWITLANNCAATVWVGALNAPLQPLPEDGGFKLDPGGSRTITLPDTWSGRFWGRSGCVFDANGMGKCDSGDCGGKALCGGSGGEPPATLVELTFSGFGGKDYYDVSLVDGYNLPIGIAPKPGSFTKVDPSNPYDCGGPTCTSDVNPTCPPELQVKNAANDIVGCRSAHQACSLPQPDPALSCAQLDDLYGCTAGGPNGVQGSCYSPNAPATCCGCPSWSPAGTCKNTNPKWAMPSQPEKYAKVFKDACPNAYSFPYDDPTSTYTCAGDDYVITFCP